MIKGEFGQFGQFGQYKSYPNYLNASTLSISLNITFTIYTESHILWRSVDMNRIHGHFRSFLMCYHFYDLYYVMQILQFSHKLGSSSAQTDNHVGHCSTDHAHHAHAYEYVPPSADCNSNYIQAVSSRCIKLYPRISIGMNNN